MPEELEQSIDQSSEADNSSNDVQKLAETLKKERQRANQLEKQLKALGNIDPDVARRAQEILQQQQEWGEREEKLRAEIDGQYRPKLDEYNRKEQAYQQQLQQKQSELLNFKRDTLLSREFVKAGGFDGEFEEIAHRLQSRTRLNPETDELEVVDGQGKRVYSMDDPSKPMSIAQLIEQLKKENIGFARHFKGFEVGGMGLSGSGKGGGNDPALSGLNPWDRLAKLREQGR